MAASGRALRIALALGALYIIWGTTYYGIRQAVQEIPPFTMAAIYLLILLYFKSIGGYKVLKVEEQSTGAAAPDEKTPEASMKSGV